MPAPVSDEAFARAAQQMGALTPAQLEAARQFQAQQAQKGARPSLAEALIQQGILTPALRENIEKKVQAQATGGHRQLGNYKLQKKLGEGGMGAVYLAEDTMLARQVAIKILPERFSSQPEFLSRFKREAIAAGKLNHPNVVGAYAVGDEGGNHYYVMEYCTGEPLDKVLKRATVFNEELALEVVAQVCRGLDYAHQHGVIHRDIKPGNIFLTSDGTAKILDLGLSKNLAAADSSFQTVSGTALGTPHYISPEQAQAEKTVDGRTDVYSLGATLYHLVTGRTPFEGSSPAAVMMKHLTEQLPDPRDLNPDLSEGVVHIITKAMAKDREDRYASCAAMLSDIELVQKGEEPSGAGLDALHSSVAMRAPVRQARAASAGAAPRKTPGTGAAGVRRTGERAPVTEEARRPTGRGREEIPAAPGSSNRMYLIVGGAVAGVLLLVGLIVALSGGNRPAATAKSKPEPNKQTPAGTTRPTPLVTTQPTPAPPTQATTPEQPAKSTPVAEPGTGPWPLHDGKEPIADYAKRVGLPATETLDLGGGVKMEFMLVPAGEFMMGQQGMAEPVHQVRIAKPFYMGKYEATVAQFRRFAEITKHVTECEKAGNKGWGWDNGWKELANVNWKQPNFPQEENHPVCLLSWNDAQAFCKWVTGSAGFQPAPEAGRMPALQQRTVRLPTEAEWEYACRAKTTTRFYVGNDDRDLDKAGWFDGNSGWKTHPVGEKAPNAWGLYDMHGNVWEWCEDRAQKDYYKESPRADPPGPTVGNDRVLRGGSWHDEAGGCGSAFRYWHGPGHRDAFDGFRLVVELAAPGATQPAAEKGVTEAWIKSVQALPAEEQVKKVVEKLKELNPQFNGRYKHEINGNKVTTLYIRESGIQNLLPVRVLVDLKKLEFGGTKVSDVTPISALPLEVLDCDYTPVADLSPLKNMRLKQLFCQGSRVSSLSVLNSMPLEIVFCDNTLVRDISPLKDCPLRHIRLDFKPERDAAILRSIKTLETINDMPVAEFWKKYPEAGTAKAEAGKVDDPERWKDAIDLLALVDPQKDSVGGNWSARNGELVFTTDVKDVSAGLRIPYEPPEQYDYRLCFNQEWDGLTKWFAIHHGGRKFNWAASGDSCGFDPVQGALMSDAQNPTRAKVSLKAGQLRTVVIQVRSNLLRFYLDSRLISEWKTDYSNVGETIPEADKGRLGVNSCVLRLLKFSRLEILEVTGKGTFTRPDDPAAKEAKKKQDEVWAERGKQGPAQPDAGALPKELSLDLAPGVKMDFVIVPAGEFDMGSNDADAKPEEKPVHKVKISKPFYMAKYETTVAQFRAFADATKYRTDGETCGDAWTWKDGRGQVVGGANWRTPGFKQTDNHPACVISWNDTQEFMKWASKQVRRTVRLPAEAEWEYACRAGTTTRFCTGDKDSDAEEAGWFKTNSGMHTMVVGQKKPNTWGLYDMHGNVWEWTQDCFSDRYYADSPAVDPKGPTTEGNRVVRGGGWMDDPGYCRSAVRYNKEPRSRLAHFGFRCVVDVPAAAP